MSYHKKPDIDVILGNSNKRFSGVTSTLLQTLSVQKNMATVKVMGKHHINEHSLVISFWQAIRLCHQQQKNAYPIIFHARRNDEMIQALILKKMLRCPIRFLFTSTAQRYHSTFSCWLMKHMDAIISTCQAAANYLSTPPLLLIPHGVQTHVWYPATDKRKAWQAVCEELDIKAEFGIGIFGRVREQKGVHLFVRACIETFKDDERYCAIISGAISEHDQDFVNHLKSEIEDNGLSTRILFLGEQAFEKIPQQMRSLHLVAALSENEGFGLTPLEAMASGTAVLTSEAGAWPEIVKNDDNGCIVKIGDQKATTDALKSLLKKPEKLEEMGQQGLKQVIQQHTVDLEAQKLCQLYRTLQQQK